MKFRSENPIYSRVNYSAEYGEEATYTGVALKTALLLLITAGVAFNFMFNVAIDLSFGLIISAMVIAPISAFIMVILAHKNEQLSFLYSILYALFEGVFLGLITLLVRIEVGDVGITFAMVGTFATLLVMLGVHSTGLIKVGQGFKSFIFTALISLIIVSLVFYIVYYSGLLSPAIGFGFYLTIILVSILLSTLYLLHDFSRIQQYVQSGASKSSEWSLSLGLMVTLVWLYIDLLRLILILSRRR